MRLQTLPNHSALAADDENETGKHIVMWCFDVNVFVSVSRNKQPVLCRVPLTQQDGDRDADYPSERLTPGGTQRRHIIL